MSEIPTREMIAKSIDHVSRGLIERDQQARLLVLAAVCGEHLLFIGPPGTAKSELARRLTEVFGGRFFERLLTRFTVPEELFGPLSLAALDDGRYERDTDGYLPTASIVFLDEVFKSNSAILNALLGVLNERRFDQGASRIEVPLVSLVGASNEIPSEESLQAFQDRFLFRCLVNPVSDEGFEELLESELSQIDFSPRLSERGLAGAQSAASQIGLDKNVREALLQLREFSRSQQIVISDRRWVRIVRALKIAAACDGRQSVSIADLYLLQFMVGEYAEHWQLVLDWILKFLGAATSVDPQRLTRVVEAFERQIDLEAEASELAFDDSGKLSLIQGLAGASDEQTEAAAPRMSAFSRRKRYSASHIGARIGQIDSVLDQTREFIEQGTDHRRNLVAQLEENLWVPGSFVARVAATLDQNQARVTVLCDRLVAVQGAYRALPLAEHDDGNLPEPVREQA
ncbi:MAG: AAA family ATPase [Quisquiliibacterium sp.]